MVKSAAPPPPEYALPASVLRKSDQLLATFNDLVERTGEFSKEVGDAVRGDPKALAIMVHSLAQVTSVVFRRWNLEILYLLSVENQLRFSQIKEVVSGIPGRSLSLKLDEMERMGLLHRAVSNNRPPHVLYSLTDAGRKLTRLSFPVVLHLNMELGLRQSLLAGAASIEDAEPDSEPV